jgi:hypothetical protein
MTLDSSLLISKLIPWVPRAIAARGTFLVFLRASDKTAGDCPNFAESAEQNGTVPFSEAVLSGALSS